MHSTSLLCIFFSDLDRPLPEEEETTDTIDTTTSTIDTTTSTIDTTISTIDTTTSAIDTTTSTIDTTEKIEVAVIVNLTVAIVVPIVVILLIVCCGSLIIIVVCGVRDRKKDEYEYHHSDAETNACEGHHKDTN